MESGKVYNKMFAISSPDIIQNDFQFKFTPSGDRIGFVRKVLGIVCFQLLITAIFTTVVISSNTLTDMVQNSVGLVVFACIISLFSSISLICSKTLSRTVPYNYLILMIWN